MDIKQEINWFGLKSEQGKFILQVLARFTEVESAKIFGSRAKGNYKKGSDVDLVLFGEKIDDKTIFQISDWLNERSTIPLIFDLLDYKKINNQSLKEHIDRVGITIYSMET
jgi:predicted nucleotidyltransferase